LGLLLEPYGLPIWDLLDAAAPHHDLVQLRVGRTLDLLFVDDDPNPQAVRYSLDEDHTLVVSREAGELEDTWTGRVDAIEYEVRLSHRTIRVESTLWEAALEVGMRARDVANLATVFEFDIDFNTEVQAGATATVIIEELWRDGELAKLGVPWAALFRNDGDEVLALRFESPTGDVGYYDEKGRSRKRAFLRSPLAFSQVTSGFNLKRFHPVLKKTRPHYGTDFGAPTGTPIRAVGQGRVVHAGRNGGHGRFVKIEHPGGYQSSYSHLSRIKVRHGQTIKQGDIIGNVGATGLATGPHLHYQFWKNGRFVNPMTVDLPRDEVVPRAQRVAFEAERDRLLHRLEAAEEATGDALAEALDTGP